MPSYSCSSCGASVQSESTVVCGIPRCGSCGQNMIPTSKLTETTVKVDENLHALMEEMVELTSYGEGSRMPGCWSRKFSPGKNRCGDK